MAYKNKLLAAKFYVCLRADEIGEDKNNKIVQFLDDGANVDEQFGNDSNNTPLHISVMNKDLVLVDLLLQRGAKTNYKNADGNTALDIALELKSDVGAAIVDTILTAEIKSHVDVDEIRELNAITETAVTKQDENNPKLAYQKRGGTSGIKGQLYISNLLSLIVIRASLNKDLEEFYLGTGLTIKNFNDVSIKYKYNNTDGVVFIQTKSKGEGAKNVKVTYQDLWRNDGDFSLHKYFHSYLKIITLTNNSDTGVDVMFKKGDKGIKCSVVLYTTADSDLKEKFITDVDSMDKNIRDLIITSNVTNIYKYNYNEEDISLLTNRALIARMECIGRTLAKYISTRKIDVLLYDECMQKFHVVLAQKVLNISETVIDGYRQAMFRKEFLYSYNAHLKTIKMTLYKSLLELKPKDKTKLKQLIEEVCLNPSVLPISKLMEYIPTYYYNEYNVLSIVDDRFNDITYVLYDVKVNQNTYVKALELSINEVIGRVNIFLPSGFGSVDIQIEDEQKREEILEVLAETIKQYFEEKKDALNSDKSVNENQESLYLKNKWVYALGNLLILDEHTNLLKFNTNEESLYKNAKTVMKKLKSKIGHLDEIALKLDMEGLPKLRLDADEQEKNKARKFLDNLWFFTNQSTEEKIEDHAIDVIHDYCIETKQEISQTDSNAHYGAIYFLIHDTVQKWWMADGESHYLSNNTKLLDMLLTEIAGKSMLNVVSCMFVKKMRQYDVEFNKDTVNYLYGQINSAVTLLVTNVNTLTGIKLTQCFKNLNDYVFIDLDNSMHLSKIEYMSMVRELKNIKVKALIILYEDVTDAKNKIFLHLTEKSLNNDYILVTNEKSAEKLRLYITSDTFGTVTDINNDLNDLDLISQEKVLDKTFIFQGGIVKYSAVLTPESRSLIKSKILQKIINNESIVIGKMLTNPFFEEIKYYIVPRSLYRITDLLKGNSSQELKTLPNTQNKEVIKINTLDELNDTVVLVGAPGMGKSTFLTYSSILTKMSNPSIWIERINLLDQTKELYRLQQNKHKISKIDALKFICRAVLSKNEIRFSIKPESIINFDLKIENGTLVLMSYNETDVLKILELQMFIHCYNQGNTILLFDGFDEICPHYKKETTEILKCLVTRCSPDTGSSMKQRMWIASRSYNNIRKTLETEFDVAYNLEMFTNDEQYLFMKKYFEINLNLDDLNIEQFQNIDAFFEYMKKASSFEIGNSGLKIYKLSSFFLTALYHAAMDYFHREINHPLRDDKNSYCQNWSLIYKSRERFNNYSNIYLNVGLLNQFRDNEKLNKALSMIFTPLHVYLVLDYFQHQIKDVNSRLHNNSSELWDLEKNTSSFYKYFLEMKLKKIRFQEKNQMDIHNPDVSITYDKELKSFLSDHKKLAFYATFKEDLHEILTDEDIEEIVIMIRGMEAGREKTGIIDCILTGGIPKFIHFNFQEYLAVEYLADLLKSRFIEQMKLWTFILRNMRDGVLDFFDRKLELDKDFMNSVTHFNTETKQMIFDDITLHQDAKEKTCESDYLKEAVLSRAIDMGFRDTTRILLGAMIDVVNETNLNKFMNVIMELSIFKSAAIFSWDDILDVILNCIRKVDSDRLFDLNPGALSSSYNKMTNPDIIGDFKRQMTMIINSNNKE